MLDGLRSRYSALRARYHDAVARVRRIERREVDDLRRWMERTDNLVHVSVLLFVPLLIGLVTALSNALDALSFLLFPPLAAGTYTLFADPEGKYASPGRFVAGLTIGALCGWAALELAAQYVYGVPPGQLHAHAGSAALSVLLTGVATWVLDVEEPAAYSTALLVLVTGTNEFAYVVSVGVSSAIVAGAFLLWREEFYEERSRFLYGTTGGDDHVLVPMRGEDAGTVATFGARLAAAHEAGKVVLLAILPADEGDREAVSPERAGATPPTDGARAPGGGSRRSGAAVPPGAATPDVAVDATDVGEADAGAADVETADAGAADVEGAGVDAADTGAGDVEGADAGAAGVGAADAGAADVDAVDVDAAAAEAAADAETAETASRRLEAVAGRIETRVGVPCEVVVAAGDDDADVVLRAARETNCDLVAVPFESDHGALSGFVRRLFRAEVDVVALRPADAREQWRDVMVAVRRPGEVAHAMVDFAGRLAGPTGRVSVCTCIDRESRRRAAEAMLADLVGTFPGRFETRVARTTVEKFVDRNAGAYDLVMVGASTDRSAASRFVSPPTFQRLSTVDGSDVAVVHQGRP